MREGVRGWDDVVVSDPYAKDRERMSRLEASNPENQLRVERAEPDYPLATCAGYPEGSHERVKVLWPDECAACWGSDPYCEPFCPICEYCGGC